MTPEIAGSLAIRLAQRRALRGSSRADTGERVIAILEAAMRGPQPQRLQVMDVAERMHISARTLKRRLHAAGLTYRHLLDRVRLSRAAEMLRCTQLSVEEIAACVGYSSAANLSRALRRWGGATPGRLRRHCSPDVAREENPSGPGLHAGLSSERKSAAR